MINITYEQLELDSKELAKKIPAEKFFGIYGVPAGGSFPAFIISKELNLPLVDDIFLEDIFNGENNHEQEKLLLIVDDLVDSGATMKRLKDTCSYKFEFATVYLKTISPSPDYFYKEIPNEWINLPHEKKDSPTNDNIVRLLQFIGDDPNREGLKDTPKRVIKSYKELYSGYGKEIKDILTVFDSEEYDQMVVLKDIEFYSTCEHHMLPFFGKAHVAYIPNGKVVGISKLARAVEIFSRRLQNQERITQQVGDALQEALGAKGVAVVLEAEHFCMKARGVNKQNSKMKTAHLTGVFKDNENKARDEFYQLIK